MGETIQIEAADGNAEAYLTGRAGDPGVLFYVDAIGLRPQIEEMADRIASWGYVVLAPHVFYRDGSAAELAPQGDLREDGAREAFFAGGLMDRVQGYTPDRALPDADAWVRTLLEYAGDGPIGVTGYCMGARLAVRTAGRFPGTVGAVGGFHGGGLVTDADDSPHLAIAGSTAEYVFGNADQD
uniref:dienelactone hydrolase family protein n=1 Tax=uncultured Nocardioides sp. TaxID=198441 RepID=UPI00261FA7D8